MSDPEFELTDELANLFEALHDGEIGWFFDRVWRAKIGEPCNGYRAETDGLLSLAEVARWLCDQALHLYPDSNFAKEYLRAHPGYQPQYPPGIP